MQCVGLNQIKQKKNCRLNTTYLIIFLNCTLVSLSKARSNAFRSSDGGAPSRLGR